MKIGIIGAGGMGRSLASKLVSLGHTVSIANSRGPTSLQEFADEIGAVASTVEDAIRNQNVIIVSIPQKNIPDLPLDLIRTLPTEVIIMETGNYYPNLRDGTIPDLEKSGIDSLWVQEQLGIPIVKVFNSILAVSLRDFGKPKGEKNRFSIPVAGDDLKAKRVVFQLVDELGFDTFDVGAITQSWKQQPGSSIYCRDITREEMKMRVKKLNRNETESFETIRAQRKADELLMASDYNAYLRGLT